MNSNIEDIGLELSDVCPSNGWHCTHFFYQFNRPRLESLTSTQIATGRDQWTRLLDSTASDAPARLQIGLVSGHKADFSLMVMDPEPILVESIHQGLMSGTQGVAMTQTYY